MSNQKTATWQLDIRADGKQAAQAAKDLETFKAAVRSSKDAIDLHRIALRSLTGTSEATKKAREGLKQKIIEEQNAISKSTIGVRKASAVLDAFKKSGGEAAKSQSGLKDAISAVGGPLASATEKIGGLSELIGSAGPVTLATVGAVGLLTIAVVGLSTALVVGAVSLARFVLESGNVLRAQGLAREAFTLGADDSERFGHQIDALALKLATPKEKLNELAVSIRRTFDGTRLSGQGIVDTLEAVASASEAAGPEVGNALKGILERSKQFGRVGINPLELVGTGAPAFTAIAKGVAKAMHSSVAAATLSLRQGRVPIDAAAAGIRDAVNEKFGAVNAKKLLDLNVIEAKFFENLQGLAKRAAPALEPIYAGLKKMADMFSDSTIQGQAIASMVESFAKILGALFIVSMPKGVSIFNAILIAALKFGIAMIGVAQNVVDFVHSAAGLSTVHGVMQLVEGTAVGIGVAIAAVTAAALAMGAALLAPFAAIGASILAAQRIGTSIGEAIRAVDWLALGRSIIEGIERGILSGVGSLRNAVGSAATAVKDEFKSLLGIHSPSRVFAEYGAQTAAGFAQGVEGGTARATSAVSEMAAAPASGGGGAASTISPSVKVEINITGAGSPEKVAQALTTQGVLDKITDAVELACRAIGVPTQTAVSA